MGQRDTGGCMRSTRNFVDAHRLGVAHGCGELFENSGALTMANADSANLNFSAPMPLFSDAEDLACVSLSYDMHARARSQEFVQRDLVGWKRGLAYRHPDPPVPVTNLFVRRPKGLHFQVSASWHSSSHW